MPLTVTLAWQPVEACIEAPSSGNAADHPQARRDALLAIHGITVHSPDSRPGYFTSDVLPPERSLTSRMPVLRDFMRG
jgi:hypothetical protein